jgi:hypothetical protein
MSDENEDYISQSKKYATVKFGRERTAAEMATDFALYAPSAREMYLATLKTPAEMSLLEASRRHSLESAIRQTHARLSKAGR